MHLSDVKVEYSSDLKPLAAEICTIFENGISSNTQEDLRILFLHEDLKRSLEIAVRTDGEIANLTEEQEETLEYWLNLHHFWLVDVRNHILKLQQDIDIKTRPNAGDLFIRKVFHNKKLRMRLRYLHWAEHITGQLFRPDIVKLPTELQLKQKPQQDSLTWAKSAVDGAISEFRRRKHVYTPAELRESYATVHVCRGPLHGAPLRYKIILIPIIVSLGILAGVIALPVVLAAKAHEANEARRSPCGSNRGGFCKCFDSLRWHKCQTCGWWEASYLLWREHVPKCTGSWSENDPPPVGRCRNECFACK